MGIVYKGFIKEKMKKELTTVRPDASFHEARTLIHDKGIRHLPVVDDKGMLVGLVTDRDIRRASPSDATTFSVHELHYLLAKLRVSSFMTGKDKLITISSDTIVEEAAQLMHDHKIGCLPVVETGGKLVGMITETDILDLFVDVFGLRLKGTRIALALEDKPGQMFGALEVIKEKGVNVISVVSPSYQIEGKRVAAIRIQTDDYKPVVAELEKRGYQILSVNTWSK
jgi:acetoin utilization protein AcuB